MAEDKREENAKLHGELASNIVTLSELLDPHLADASQPGKAATPERWSYRRAAVFIIAASLILWGIIIAVAQHVYWLMALRGRQ